MTRHLYLLFCFEFANLLVFLVITRGCPKAYHPTCVNRDDAFFRAKGKWNCGMFHSYFFFCLHFLDTI